MKIELFAICDSATHDADGKLNITGAFDNVVRATLPYDHPDCMVVARVRYERDDEGLQTILVRLTDPDGAELLPAIGCEVLCDFPGDTTHVPLTVMAGLSGLRSEKYGDHVLECLHKGTVLASTPLLVTRKPAY